MPSIRKCNKIGGGGGGGVTVVNFKISDIENVNFASFSTRRYNGVLWKILFFGSSLLHKYLYSEKKRVTMFFSKTNTVRLDDSLHKNMSMSPT